MTGIAVATNDWLLDTPRDLWQVPLSAAAMLIILIATVRMTGLRSFSKLSSFDFAVTVSIGSILGGVATSSAPLANGAVAAVSLLAIQATVSLVRSRRASVERGIDNTPLLLMDGAEMLDDNLRSARVTHSDVIAKLRMANVLRLQDVQAVVLETTGDISVLHGADQIDPAILEDLRRGPTTDRIETIDRNVRKETPRRRARR